MYCAGTGMPKALRGVIANAGIEAQYRRRIKSLIDEMAASVLYWLKASYRKNEPVLAQDAVAADELQKAIRKLTRYWNRRFAQDAVKMGEYFSKSSYRHSDATLKAILKDAGITVKFTITPAMRDCLKATMNQQVSLIKSIPQEYMAKVEGAVMRSVQSGRDLKSLTDEIMQTGTVTRKRAAFIARDQNNKATASLNRARRLDLGITKAVWHHSHGGKEPRPTHVKMDGKTFDVRKGMYDSATGTWIQPGEEINCFPGDIKVNSLSGIRSLWRSNFNGEMVNVNIGSYLLKGTPNHPILTENGWIKLSNLKNGDNVVCMRRQNVTVIDNNKYYRIPTFHDLYKSLSIAFVNNSTNGSCFDFYGDITDNQINQIIILDENLSFNFNPGFLENLSNLNLSESDSFIIFTTICSALHVLGSNVSSFRNQSLPFIVSKALHSNTHRCGSATHDVVSFKNASNVSSRPYGESKFFSNGGSPHSLLIHGDQNIGQTFPICHCAGDVSRGFNTPAEIIRIASDPRRGDLDGYAPIYEFNRVTNKFVRDASCHVYTMETFQGIYSVSDAFVQAKNCRCFASPVIEGFE
jgi:hypothetical protein